MIRFSKLLTFLIIFGATHSAFPRSTQSGPCTTNCTASTGGGGNSGGGGGTMVVAMPPPQQVVSLASVNGVARGLASVSSAHFKGIPRPGRGSNGESILVLPPPAVKALQDFKTYCDEAFKGKVLSYGSSKDPVEEMATSLRILTRIIDKGPLTEAEALGLKADDPRLVMEGKEKLTLTFAFKNALASYKKAISYLAANSPEILENPKQQQVLSYVRDNLDILRHGFYEVNS